MKILLCIVVFLSSISSCYAGEYATFQDYTIYRKSIQAISYQDVESCAINIGTFKKGCSSYHKNIVYTKDGNGFLRRTFEIQYPTKQSRQDAYIWMQRWLNEK